MYVLRYMFTSFVCLELGEKCKPESVGLGMRKSAKSYPPRHSVPRMTYMTQMTHVNWRQFLAAPAPAVGPVTFVMVAASPILNVLPVVPPIPDHYSPLLITTASS